MRSVLLATVFAVVAAVTVPALAQAPAAPAVQPAATPLAALSDSRRPAEDLAKDANRKPMEMLAFARIRPGQTVVDFVPGGGYFTRLFAVAVGPKGKVYDFVPAEVADKYKMGENARGLAAAYPNVQAVIHPINATPDAPVADLVWTAQNYHDLHTDLFGKVDIAAFNKAVYAALKPGGLYVIIDHVGPAGADVPDKLHRIDPAVVRQEVEAAGFKFDGESKVLHNPSDPHTALVFDPSIRGHTDQFAFRFRKPGLRRGTMRLGASIAVLLVALACTPATAAAAAAARAGTTAPQAFAPAVADPLRPEKDRARDAVRKPSAMLAFAQVRPGQWVIDLLPGGGYFTRLFARAVGPRGHVYALLTPDFAESRTDIDPVAKAYANVEVVVGLPDAAAGQGTVDLVWTALNYHDLKGGRETEAVNAAAFRALKPGGLYVVVDHAAAAGSGAHDVNSLHRIDAALVKSEVEAAGFRLDAESDVLKNPADPHTAKVFDPAIRGHTDQFVLRFRKPR